MDTDPRLCFQCQLRYLQVLLVLGLPGDYRRKRQAAFASIGTANSALPGRMSPLLCSVPCDTAFREADSQSASIRTDMEHDYYSVDASRAV